MSLLSKCKKNIIQIIIRISWRSVLTLPFWKLLGRRQEKIQLQDYWPVLEHFLLHHAHTSQNATQGQEQCIPNPSPWPPSVAQQGLVSGGGPRRAATHHQEHENSIAIPRHKRALQRATKQTCLQSPHQVFQCLTEELAWLKISHPWTWEHKDYCDLNWISKASSNQAANQPAIHVGDVTWNTIIPSATCTELSGHLPPNITQT